MKTHNIYVYCLLVLSTLLTSGIYAQTQTNVPRIISYQGQISDNSGKPAEGKHTISVSLYSDESGNNKIWTSAKLAEIHNGIFVISLGSIDNPLPEQLPGTVYLGTSIDGTSEMRPLTLLTGSPYALTVPDASITKEKMATDYVGAIKIDGQKVTEKGGILNLKSGPGMSMDYDKTTHSVMLSNTSGIGNATPQTANSTVYWSENGNVGTTPGTNYVGTSDSVNLEIHAFHSNPDSASNTGRVMLFQPRRVGGSTYVPNIIAGSHNNSIGTSNFGSTISGGMTNSIGLNSSYSTISGGVNGTISSNTEGASLHGGHLNLIQTYATGSSISGGESNTIFDSVEYGAIPGGVGLAGKSYAQALVGRYNAFQGSSRSNNIYPNDRLFIVGNGIDADHRSNAFEVSNTGHSIVYHKNGKYASAIRGATYTDNIVYAWGYFETGGTIHFMAGFGVDTIIRTATGHYHVTLDLKNPDGTAMCLDTTDGAVIVSQYQQGHDCYTIQASSLFADTTSHISYFDVISQKSALTKTYNLAIPPQLIDVNLVCQDIDSDWMFIVVGRPRDN